MALSGQNDGFRAPVQTLQAECVINRLTDWSSTEQTLDTMRPRGRDHSESEEACHAVRSRPYSTIRCLLNTRCPTVPRMQYMPAGYGPLARG